MAREQNDRYHVGKFVLDSFFMIIEFYLTVFYDPLSWESVYNEIATVDKILEEDKKTGTSFSWLDDSVELSISELVAGLLETRVVRVVTTHSFPIFETKIRLCTIIFFFLLARTMISGVVFWEFRAKILRKLTFADQYPLGNARNSSQSFWNWIQLPVLRNFYRF